MMKRILVVLLLVPLSAAARGEFNVVESGIVDMQQAMAGGRVTSRELVPQYLTRIALYDKKLNAVMTVNAILLGALEDAQPDPHDPVKTCQPPPDRDYTRFLIRDALAGARIGIPRTFYYERITPPGLQAARGGLNAEAQRASLRFERPAGRDRRD